MCDHYYFKADKLKVKLRICECTIFFLIPWSIHVWWLRWWSYTLQSRVQVPLCLCIIAFSTLALLVGRQKYIWLVKKLEPGMLVMIFDTTTIVMVVSVVSPAKSLTIWHHGTVVPAIKTSVVHCYVSVYDVWVSSWHCNGTLLFISDEFALAWTNEIRTDVVDCINDGICAPVGCFGCGETVSQPAGSISASVLSICIRRLGPLFCSVCEKTAASSAGNSFDSFVCF